MVKMHEPYSVSSSPSGIPPLLPTISIVPGVLSIAEGLSANLTCNSSQPAQFVWSFNAVAPLPGNVEVQNVTSRVSVLRVVSAGLTNAGSYYCKALFADGQATTAYADLIFIGNQSAWKGLMLGGGSLHFREGHKMWQV